MGLYAQRQPYHVCCACLRVVDYDAQWAYNDMIADLTRTPRLPPYYKSVYTVTGTLRKSDGAGYRDLPAVATFEELVAPGAVEEEAEEEEEEEEEDTSHGSSAAPVMTSSSSS